MFSAKRSAMKPSIQLVVTVAIISVGAVSAKPIRTPRNATVLETLDVGWISDCQSVYPFCVLMCLQKRTPGGVELCTDINWGGTCGYAVQPLNTCIILGDDWKNKISSFGPDPCQVCFGKLLYQSTKKMDWPKVWLLYAAYNSVYVWWSIIFLEDTNVVYLGLEIATKQSGNSPTLVMLPVVSERVIHGTTRLGRSCVNRLVDWLPTLGQ